ncbi:DUF5063 domain-containing protein [Undibacterium baiyunense]|uniref:DUF5063 domain-containing protein n=1 Tax=Undibacterium baiyunense TaxID=2828731 RepID=A0A941DGT8_9BURK|nr:DUF5063 domain-containing protein [Undibacterium baiyunense]MBR7747363.1 DUF5063 domain-containing protein [Undibacterium baiyunense]
MESPLKNFAEVARKFCAWAETQPVSTENEVKTAIELLANLSSAILATSNLGFGEDLEGERISDEEWRVTYNRFGFLPFNYYSTFFNPANVGKEEPVIGDLADDLADIYRDLKAGFWLYDRGHVKEAVWEWRQSFQTHWGRHATGALYALHAWSTNESIQL